MHLATLIAAAAAGAEEHSGNIMLDTIVFPIIAMAFFGALALVTFSYRNVSNRHAAKADAYARSHGATHGESGTGHGH